MHHHGSWLWILISHWPPESLFHRDNDCHEFWFQTYHPNLFSQTTMVINFYFQITTNIFVSQRPPLSYILIFRTIKKNNHSYFNSQETPMVTCIYFRMTTCVFISQRPPWLCTFVQNWPSIFISLGYIFLNSQRSLLLHIFMGVICL